MGRPRIYANHADRQAAYRQRHQRGMTPFWSSPDGRYRVYHGDCLAVLPALAPSQLVMITDPPYGLGLGILNNQQKDRRHLAKHGYASYEDTYENFISVIVPRVNIYLDVVKLAAIFSGPYLREQRQPTSMGGIYLPSATGRTPWGSKNFLPILFYGIPPGAGQHRPTVLQSTVATEPSQHPCAKPLAWMTWLVALASEPHQTIIDPFMGSATTGVACIRLRRPFIGIECDETYCEEAVERMERELRQAVLPFDEPLQLSLS